MGPGDEVFRPHAGAGRRCQLAGCGIDIHTDNSVGSIPAGDITVLAMLMRALHELGPDGQRGLCSLDVQFVVVVVSNPNHAYQFRCESGEPPVVRGAGFSSGGQCEAARANACAGSTAQNFLQQIDHQIVHPGIENRMAIRLRFEYGRALLAADQLDPIRLHHNAFVRVHGVGSGNLYRRNFVGAQRHGRRRPDLHVQAGFPCQIHHRAITGLLGKLHCGDIHRLGDGLP